MGIYDGLGSLGFSLGFREFRAWGLGSVGSARSLGKFGVFRKLRGSFFSRLWKF